MKLTITHYNTTYSLETDRDDVSLEDLLDGIKGLLVASGFHPRSVDRHILTECNWFDETEESYGDINTSLKFPSDFEAKH